MERPCRTRRDLEAELGGLWPGWVGVLPRDGSDALLSRLTSRWRGSYRQPLAYLIRGPWHVLTVLELLEGSLFQGGGLPAPAAELSRATQLLPPRLGSQDLAPGDTGQDGLDGL
jgi:hypothetical protein